MAGVRGAARRDGRVLRLFNVHTCNLKMFTERFADS